MSNSSSSSSTHREETCETAGEDGGTLVAAAAAAAASPLLVSPPHTPLETPEPHVNDGCPNLNGGTTSLQHEQQNQHTPPVSSSRSVSASASLPPAPTVEPAVVVVTTPPSLIHPPLPPPSHHHHFHHHHQQQSASTSYLLRSRGFLPTYKLLLVGDAGVGKTNLLGRYCRNEFDPYAAPTIGVEFVSRELHIPTGRVGECEKVVAQIWDTAGQEQCSVISNAYYRNAVGAVVAYDVTRRESFLNVPRWAGHLRALASDDCVCIVVGNKIDRPIGEWAVTAEEAEQLAHTLGMRHFSCSAVNGSGVLHAFTQVVLAVNAIQSLKLEQSDFGGGGVASASWQSSPSSPSPQHRNNTNQNGNGDNGSSSDAYRSPGSPITRSAPNLFVAEEEHTMWTTPSTVPAGQLSTAANATNDGSGSGTSPSPPPPVPVPSSSSSLFASHTPSSAVTVADVASAEQQQQQQRSRVSGVRKTLDLRGFGSGEEGVDLSSYSAGGYAC